MLTERPILENNARLHSIVLDLGTLSESSEAYGWIPTLISQVESPRFRKIHVQFNVSKITDLDVLPLKKLADLLLQEKFIGVDRLSFSVSPLVPSRSSDDYQEAIRTHFPDATARGFLGVIVHEPA